MIFMFSGRIYTSAYRTDVESTYKYESHMDICQLMEITY